jgi:hypothetical protein
MKPNGRGAGWLTFSEAATELAQGLKLVSEAGH